MAASVVCRCRPRATAPVWFEPMAPSPCVWPRRLKCAASRYTWIAVSPPDLDVDRF